MRTLTTSEKRTIRFAAIAITVYLALFFGVRSWRHLEARKAAYQDLVVQVQRLNRDLRPAENRIALTEKLKETYQLDPSKLSRATAVADVSAAIQKAAGTVKIQLAHVRETVGRSSGKELAAMQLDGSGPAPAVMTLLHRLDRLGYPVIVDSLQITGEPTKPGMVKVSLTIVIPDFERWKPAEAPNA